MQSPTKSARMASADRATSKKMGFTRDEIAKAGHWLLP